MSRRPGMVSQSPIDVVSFAEATARPGNDPRQWVSNGIVTAGEDGQVVQFRTDLGQVMVSVTLHPSLTPVYCRVGSHVAGAGEADYHPFVEGDEVVVVLPEGREDSNPTIICRLNSSLDPFPMDSVAGQDPTTNSFAFTRRRAPYVQEYAGPVLIRSALSTAFLSIDETGQVVLKDSQNAALQIGADLIGFQGPSTPDRPPEFLLQLDLTHRHFSVQVGDAIMCLSASDATPEQSTITLPGPFTIGTGGNPPLEHATSTEAVANVLEKLFVELGAIIGASGAAPLTGASFAALIAAWLIAPSFPACWAAAAVAPLGSVSPTLPGILAGLFAAPLPKPQTGGFQTNPGIGSAGLLIG